MILRFSMNMILLLFSIWYTLFKILSIISLSIFFNEFLFYSHLNPYLYIIIEIEIWIEKHWIKIFVIIDSEYFMNIIDSHFIIILNIFSIFKLWIIKYIMINNKISINNIIIYDITMKIKIDSHRELLILDIIKLHNYFIILNISWFKLHNS